jgi:broad specificity phosphatase PhoE
MSITFLRHGPLSVKYQNRYNGHRNIPIDKILFDISKTKVLQNKVFDLVISSDLDRCTQTLKKINQSFTIDKRLREVKFKREIEGKSFEEVEELESFNIKYLENETTWHNYICDETQQVFKSRLQDFLAALPSNKKILICSHAGAIKEMLNILEHPIQEINYLEYIEVDNEL